MSSTSTVEQNEQSPLVPRVTLRLLNITAQEEKHLRLAIYIKVILFFFILIYMGWAYSNIRILDADLLVIGAKEKVIDILPDAKAKMKERLTQMAPEVTNQVGDGILQNVPKLEQNIEELAKKTLVSYVDPLEKEMAAWMMDFLKETKAVSEEMFPGMPSYQKIKLMRSYILEDLVESLTVVSYEIGDAVKEQGFIEKLKHLVRGKNLTEKEKLQRDIIALWYVLVERKLADMDLNQMAPITWFPEPR
ncbi:MAG: hypothetical protein HQK55_13185 [Deltaproteobacteria bacterium]|nr:hypothetical protein [Deltaproteobacteria bacterium]